MIGSNLLLLHRTIKKPLNVAKSLILSEATVYGVIFQSSLSTIELMLLYLYHNIYLPKMHLSCSLWSVMFQKPFSSCAKLTSVGQLDW